MIHPHPNWLQRRYFTWAQPRYDRMEPGLREAVQRADLWLYSAQGAFAWAALAGAMAGSAGMLWWLGVPWWGAVAASLLVWVAAAFVAGAAWLRPEGFTLRRGAFALLSAIPAAFLGVVVGHVLASAPDRGWAVLMQPIWAPTLRQTVAIVAVAGPLLALGWGVAAWRRWQMRRSLATSQQAQALAEARLHALQAQIQPHFIFNTLATVQHWVDSGDARASGLLRDLTAFLRGATELFARPLVPLADEAAWVGHYLAVQKARLGARLQARVDVAADAAASPLPPGLLLTLVENAVEHGIAPTMAGGEVAVRAWREGGALHLGVTDSGAGPPDSSAVSAGTGLANTRARLAAAFGDRATLTLAPRAGGGTEAHIAIEAAA